MSAGSEAVVETASRIARADDLGAPVSGGKLSLTKREETRARSRHVAIASALFFALLAAALLFGGHAAIAPLLQAAASTPNARETGDVVYTMPDGIFCRHVTFDNVTGDIAEGGLERCTNNIAKRNDDEVPAFDGANR